MWYKLFTHNSLNLSQTYALDLLKWMDKASDDVLADLLYG